MEQKKNFKGRVLHETYMLLFLTLYLALFLISLTIYKAIILGVDIWSFFRFGYNLIEAAVLAKFILIGQMFRLGERFTDKILIIPVIYRSVVFTLFIFVLTVIEDFITGYLKGKASAEVWREFIAQGFNEKLGKMLIAIVVLFLLFCFLEICRVFGESKIFNLFFRKNKS